MKLKITLLAAVLATGLAVTVTPAAPAQGQTTTKVKPKPNTIGIPMFEVDADTLLPISRHRNAVKGAVYADPSRCAADRAMDLLRRMTFEEKVDMTGGWNKFMTHGVERLGIRPVSMADAGQGVRLETAIIHAKSTSFPAVIALASTWDPDLAIAYGRAIGSECRALGVDILLGPGVNMQRLSVSGRNFEYFGEDPLLAKEMAREYVLGLQGQGVIATPKCFIGYDQEFVRHIASSNIDERTLREIYLPIWEGVVTQAGALAMMTGNNLVNGLPSYANRELVDGLLRGELGFHGIAMTDWQNSSYFPDLQNKVLTSGMSLMMPVNATLRDYIEQQAALSPDRKAEIEQLVDRMAYYTLYPLFAMGIYDRPSNAPEYFKNFPANKALAREVATDGIVLLKNDKAILPVLPAPAGAAGKKIVLIGREELQGGSGSGAVVGYDHTSFREGLKRVYGDNLTVLTTLDDAASAAIRKADVVLFSLVKEGSEGRDIPFEEPVDQLDQLCKVVKLNRNVIVLISAANGLPTDWLKDVRGVLWCYFLGQERGLALADVISGKVTPSGKLPFTIERSFADSPAPTFNYIGGKPYWRGNNEYRSYFLGFEPATKDDFSKYMKPGEIVQVPYSEGIFMGYRWFDRKNPQAVVFPFGAGLSYATFAYNTIAVHDAMASDGYVYVDVNLSNTGKVDAKEVVQLYVRETNPTVERPVKELKAFAKVALKASESKTVTLKLDRRAFSFWDIAAHNWKMNPGQFTVMAGGSSANLPLTAPVTLK